MPLCSGFLKNMNWKQARQNDRLFWKKYILLLLLCLYNHHHHCIIIPIIADHFMGSVPQRRRRTKRFRKKRFADHNFRPIDHTQKKKKESHVTLKTVNFNVSRFCVRWKFKFSFIEKSKKMWTFFHFSRNLIQNFTLIWMMHKLLFPTIRINLLVFLDRKCYLNWIIFSCSEARSSNG